MILITFLVVLTSSCEKDGEPAITPIKNLRPISFKGFVMGDTLEQYFDGVKMREYYGKASFNGNMAYEKEDVVKMELKKKSSGEVLYTQSIKSNGPADKPINFFYDGVKVTETYLYPAGVDGVEQIAFYFDFPPGMALDVAYGDGSDVNAAEYLVRNVQPKQWTEFIKIPPLEGEMYVFLLKAGKKEYLIDNDVNYSFMSAGIQLPNKYGYEGGGVQSWYVGLGKEPSGKVVLYPQEDLVPLFRK